MNGRTVKFPFYVFYHTRLGRKPPNNFYAGLYPVLTEYAFASAIIKFRDYKTSRILLRGA